ncbi:asparaginase [Azotobacter vinelandii]|uniref:asparaginase n=1 Tax=Azotobacter vinelandii TaxID=354 RepID=UPI002666756A|nr:asparaginase [Azotobacter vinelandii]WKN22164.1 asparaginase [Azotobacter vinelandii]
MAAIDQLMVLYSGGTIGMQAGPRGLVPAAGFDARLRERLIAEPQRRMPPWRYRELSPPIDSANMHQGHWLTLRDAIVAAVEKDGCNAVLLLHGTDTLAYSAAALSFLLLGLGVPVVLTGAMLPASVPGSDAWDNLFGAVDALAQGLVPGVHLYFGGRLLHGARASKLGSATFEAFAELPRRRHGSRTATLPAGLDYHTLRQPVNLAVLPLFPGLRATQLRALLDSGVQGLVLECYGSGTGPSDDAELLEALREARQRGTVLLGISQCPHGHVAFDTYAAGDALREAGLIGGDSMTREAALGKLFALLGAGLPAEEAEYWLAQDLCGECADSSPAGADSP